MLGGSPIDDSEAGTEVGSEAYYGTGIGQFGVSPTPRSGHSGASTPMHNSDPFALRGFSDVSMSRYVWSHCIFGNVVVINELQDQRTHIWQDEDEVGNSLICREAKYSLNYTYVRLKYLTSIIFHDQLSNAGHHVQAVQKNND